MQQCRLYRQTVVIYTVMVLILCLLVIVKMSKHVAVQIVQTAVIYTVMILIVCLLVIVKMSKHVAVQIVQTDCFDIFTVMVLIVRLLVIVKVSKHVAVQFVQTDFCDIYCYGIDCVFVGYSKNVETCSSVECTGRLLWYILLWY